MTLLLGGLVVLAAAPERLLEREAAAGLGLVSSGFATAGGRTSQLSFAPSVAGRLVLGGFVVEGGLLLSAPLARDTTLLSLSGQARVGWSAERWAVVAGAVLQWAPEGTPTLQVLPTARGQVSFGRLGLTLGVFDHFGLVPGHLSVDLAPLPGGRFSLGWVAPLGVIGSADVQLPAGFGLRVTGFAWRLGGAELAMVILAGTFGGAP